MISRIFGCVLLMCCNVLNAQEVQIKSVDNQELENMVVYLMPLEGQTNNLTTTSEPIEIHQKNKQFAPYITVVQKGYQVQFVNDDDITHHIYSALGPKRFSFKLKAGDDDKAMALDKAGHVSMGCNIHDWMTGHILVLDTPFYAQTSEQGTAHFDNIPDGKYQLIVWHPQLQSIDNKFVQTISLPQLHPINVKLTNKINTIPEQKSLDDFEFLEGY